MSFFPSTAPQSRPDRQKRSNLTDKQINNEKDRISPMWTSNLGHCGVGDFHAPVPTHSERSRYSPVSPYQHSWRPPPSPVQFTGSVSPSRSLSPYGFKPIKPNMQIPRVSPLPRFVSPTMIPPGKESPSPSVITADTELMTIDSLSNYSPVSFRPLTPGTPFGQPTVQETNNLNGQSPLPERKSPAPKGRKSPFKNNDDDMEVRKTRLKTEMCLHYSSGRTCPFGDKCTYAHGEEELQMTKLLDLSKAGLIDAETYRIKPCLTWVATGSCPFGKRCTHIHDPRVGGSHSSWLPVTETQGNSMETDINVEAQYQKRTFAALFGTPFGSHFSLENDSWSDLYKTVCNVDYRQGKNSGLPGCRRKPVEMPIKLKIALLMRGDNNWHFIFRPQHLIHEEMCMILQRRVFRVGKECAVTELEAEAYNPRHQNHIVVHELAFGPDEDPSVRTVALWFNLDESSVIACNAQQAKRFRWKKGIMKVEIKKSSAFDKLDSFPMIRPYEKEAYDFATELLQHRLEVLLAERVAVMSERHVRVQALKTKKDALQEKFNIMQRQWKSWEWPVNKGRSVVTKNTPVPKIEAEYEFCEECDNLNTVKVWRSFTSADLETNPDVDDEDSCEGLNLQLSRRLRHFTLLAEGREIAKDRSLPLIHPVYKKPPQHDDDIQDRVWKALLLSNPDGEETEWELVQKHFKQSRSNKVLSILQDVAPPLNEEAREAPKD